MGAGPVLFIIVVGIGIAAFFGDKFLREKRERERLEQEARLAEIREVEKQINAVKSKVIKGTQEYQDARKKYEERYKVSLGSKPPGSAN